MAVMKARIQVAPGTTEEDVKGVPLLWAFNKDDVLGTILGVELDEGGGRMVVTVELNARGRDVIEKMKTLFPSYIEEM